MIEPSASEKETEFLETTDESQNVPVLSHHLTENGMAVSQIVIAEGASQLERFAAEELVYHIKKVAPRCPHLGCALRWNAQERSWDCP